MMDWLNNPALQNIDPLKKELFKQAAAKVNGKQGNSMASVLMAMISSANKQGIRFTPDEIALILDIMKQGKSKQEQQQIDQMVKMVSQMAKKG